MAILHCIPRSVTHIPRTTSKTTNRWPAQRQSQSPCYRILPLPLPPQPLPGLGGDRHGRLYGMHHVFGFPICSYAYILIFFSFKANGSYRQLLTLKSHGCGMLGTTGRDALKGSRAATMREWFTSPFLLSTLRLQFAVNYYELNSTAPSPGNSTAFMFMEFSPKVDS